MNKRLNIHNSDSRNTVGKSHYYVWIRSISSKVAYFIKRREDNLNKGEEK